jgi:gliding motility-associated-like protein
LWSGNNAITQSNTVSTSGTYTVTVTNSDGCSATSPGVLVTVNSATVPTITASGSTTICQGTNVLLTASAGTAYAWSSGETSQSILASTAGQHTVTVTNANGCTATSAATTIIVNNLPSVAAITGANSICEGSTTTLASATVGGVWSSSNTGVASVSTSGVVTGVANGNTVLTYTVTDVNGCTNSANAFMTVNGLPVAAISANGATTFCAGGSVTLTSSTGTSYAWVGGDISPSITLTTSGSYYVQVTNAAGCTSTSAPITVVVNPLPTVAPITGSGNVCFGLTTQMSNLTTGGIWSSADNAIASIDATTGVVTGNAVGATVLTYTVTNASGCSSSATWLMTVNASPSVTIAANGPTTFCQGSSVTLTATPGATYLWNNNEITQSIDVTNAGLYFVTITNAAGCTAVSNSINVNVNGLSSAVITASGPLTFCQGDNVTLTATPGTNYLWSTGETTQSIVVTSTMAVHVDVTNATGCVTSSAITYVTVIPSVQAVITANGPTTLCLGSSVTLSGPTANGVSYIWDNGVTTTSTQSITVNTGGVYSLTVSTGNGCSSTATQTVLVNPNPNVTITANGPTLFCQGGSVTLTASGATSYVWSDGSITPSITTSIPGNYFVVGTNNNGCESTSATTAVTVSTIPAVSAITGANNVCESSSVQLTSATANGIWTSSNNFIATVSSTGLVTGLNAGTTTITYTVTNGACSSSVSSVMNVLNLPVVPTITPSGATTMCPGGTVILFASNAANYQWSSGPQTPLITVNQSGDYTVTVTNASGCSATSLPITVFIGDNTNPVIVPPANVTMAPNFACEAIGVNLGAPVTSDNCSVATVSNDAPAIFPLGLTTVTWTVVDGSGNTSTATQLVNIVDNILPTINVNDLTVVINDNGSTTITFSDVDNGTTDNCGIASMTLSQYTFDCSNIGDNTVTVTVTDNNGNVATTSVLITVVTSGTDTDNDGLLNACDTDDDGDGIVDTNEEVGDTDGDGIPNTLDPDDDGDGISTVIEGTDDQDGDGISNYLDSDSDGDGLSDDFEWDFGGLAEPGQDCDQDGLYDFLDTDKCGPVVPDAFTPNGNNYNDLFVVPGIEAYETRQLFVYSRYGTLVYESNLYNNDWDGTLLNSGSPVPDGTYYYVFKLDNDLIVNGYVYINRVKK